MTVLVSVLLRPAGFPRWPGLAEIRSVVRFGKHASGIYLFGQAGKSAPEIIIGRALDMPSVAYFSRANGLIEIFHRTVLKAILPVCMPYFARSNREQGNIVPGYLAAGPLFQTSGGLSVNWILLARPAVLFIINVLVGFLMMVWIAYQGRRERERIEALRAAPIERPAATEAG
jgi:hypothetical protein